MAIALSISPQPCQNPTFPHDQHYHHDQQYHQDHHYHHDPLGVDGAAPGLLTAELRHLAFMANLGG